jgi:uncharacterized membrane protein YfcA
MNLPNKVYDVLKWVAMIAIDALATAFSVIAQAWGAPMEIVTPVVITLTALGTLLGALIGVSTANYNKQ